MDGESGASNAPRKEEITRLTDGAIEEGRIISGDNGQN